ncbi:hypothetical protein [Desulfovibrio sp. Huiquan2017]|uniref:hypothetical protein n=1 Tax=Desulfovibrio sp. Huiquan2017 TaxID=2816861 RepID=UPI001A92606F|nr:hypothetical protein [Desulfovibrio sp. Huiquan2017]
MRLTEIFNDVKNQWPNEILIGDCIMWNNKDGLSCEWLDRLWWKIDTDSIVHGEWGRLMCWGIFCGIKQHIKSLQLPYPNIMHIDELDIGYAVEKINESINCIESVYYKERGEHINDLQTLIDER